MKILLLILSGLLCGCKMKAHVESKPEDALSEANKKLEASIARLQKVTELRNKQQDLDQRVTDIMSDCARVEPEIWRRKHCAARKKQWLKEDAELHKEYDMFKAASAAPQENPLPVSH